MQERNLRSQLEKLKNPKNIELPAWNKEESELGKTMRAKHLQALNRLHRYCLSTLSEVVAQVQHLDKNTKNIIINGSSMEMVLIRAAYLQVSPD